MLITRAHSDGYIIIVEKYRFDAHILLDIIIPTHINHIQFKHVLYMMVKHIIDSTTTTTTTQQ